MGELISRQAAIDALYSVDEYNSRSVKAFKQLPPIHPEPSEECERCMMEHMDAMEELETKLAMAEPHWIPVTENCDCDLMDNEEVLVFQKDGTINGQIRHAMFCDFNDKKKFVTWEEGMTIYNVVAYMPLPEPYKGVTE